MNRIIVFALLACLSACAPPQVSEVKPPPEIVSRDTFLLMLTEVQLIEGVYKQRLLRNDDQKVHLKSYYAELFQRFSITESRFLTSYKWWYDHPSEMDELLKEAAEGLTAWERESVQEESNKRNR
tara:strand:- start:72 stop:446 length:375 start_codon:yes stop_codon:yes gene_type:complete